MIAISRVICCNACRFPGILLRRGRAPQGGDYFVPQPCPEVCRACQGPLGLQLCQERRGPRSLYQGSDAGDRDTYDPLLPFKVSSLCLLASCTSLRVTSSTHRTFILTSSLTQTQTHKHRHRHTRKTYQKQKEDMHTYIHAVIHTQTYHTKHRKTSYLRTFTHASTHKCTPHTQQTQQRNTCLLAYVRSLGIRTPSLRPNRQTLRPCGAREQKPFEDATFAMQVGQISDMVDTDSGVHIIMRTA